MRRSVAMRERRAPGRLPGIQGPYWVIYDGNVSGESWAGLLTVRFPEWGKILPVFGGRDDALGFLRGWRPVSSLPLEVLQTARAPLASALLGPLTDVDRIVFDPLPEPDLRDTIRLASLCRGAFVDLVLGRGKAWSARGDGYEDPSWLRRGVT